jgi:RES domain-containing protein
MEVYRISKKEFAAIDGSGGLFYPGRWHIAGYRVLYAAQYRSLAALEYLVHLSSAYFLNNKFVITTLSIPDVESVKVIDEKKLGDGWTNILNISKTQKIGTSFLEKANVLVLQVPSAIIPDEFNFIINPSHKAFSKCKIVDVQNFKFDTRLAKV